MEFIPRTCHGHGPVPLYATIDFADGWVPGPPGLSVNSLVAKKAVVNIRGGLPW